MAVGAVSHRVRISYAPISSLRTSANVWFLDADGDPYGTASTSETAVNQPVGYVNNSDDCDDSDAEKYSDNGC